MSTEAERSSLTLADGRTLTYLEFGDADGVPVLHHHGGLVSASDVAALDGVARDTGVRLVSFDRPGVAGSSPRPGRTVLDGAADAEQLLDHLGISDVRLTGWSMGGQYALATAYLLAERVQRTAVIAGAVPLDDPATVAELNEMDRRFTAMAADHPAKLRSAAAALGGLAAFSPRSWAAMAAHGEGAIDAKAVRAVAHELAGSAAAATSQHEGVVEEYLAWVRPWGFGLADVVSPVDVWQGSEDHLLPPEWGRRLAAGLGSGSLHLVEGVGHFLLLTHADEVLAALLATDLS